ncbi:PREDICTED: inositol 1,4,5-trisphosphate receptor-interacting protein-like 1 [Sturnus vulgaris]|uniref:inositol 1,4,5-trisphosphate receptor-interacting protein-like 1 n=1 Tax=Sturnus vulgaris TaxID=9172 RepID=UPI00071A67D1|nr:PREDICTED: inositol 1,4,5-trisphosphate receptor-interacting protein-like 1 [Sturnus vulgaris]
MDSWVFWFLLLQSMVQYLQPVDDGLDEVTCLRMEARAKLQEQEKIRLEREVEQLTLMQSGTSWGGDLLWSALQPWQVWAFAGLLVLLAVWFMWRKRSHKAEISDEKEKEKQKEEEEEDEIWAYDLRWLLDERIQWPVQDLQTGCNRTMALIDNFTSVIGRALTGTFYPVLQQAIGFGSAFEGWTARGEEVVYHVLIPLSPPLGHTFHLERDNDQQKPGRNFRVRVKLECSCPREHPGVNLLCFLHHPDVVRRRTQQPNLLDSLCTSFFLDVQKIVLWFCALVRASWRCLPQSRSWHLVLLASTRSCNLRLNNDQESFLIKVLFGVRRHASDIFITSRPRGAQTPSIMWPETYAVAETKFFRHMARQAPQDSSHIKCLQLLACVLAHKDFSIHSVKTIIMRLLNTIPVSRWHRRYFLLQLSDALEQLRLSLEEKHLEHFILGNQRLPEEIRLPQDVRRAKPPNLFHGLVQDPAAHSQAMQAYLDLHHRLARVLAYGQF